jgi:hypothetical protein
VTISTGKGADTGRCWLAPGPCESVCLYDAVRLETSLDDGRFTGVVKGPSVEHSGAQYLRSCWWRVRCVRGLQTGADPAQHARRVAHRATRLIREVPSKPCGSDR